MCHLLFCDLHPLPVCCQFGVFILDMCCHVRHFRFTSVQHVCEMEPVAYFAVVVDELLDRDGSDLCQPFFFLNNLHFGVPSYVINSHG